MQISKISFLAIAVCIFYLPTSYAENTKDNVTCVACEITVEALEEYINFGHNEEAIIGNLTQACHDAFDGLPPFIAPIFLDVCIGFANVTVRDMIDLIQQGLDPEHVCTVLGLCDDEKFLKLNVVLKALRERKAQVGSETIVCRLCKNAVEEIEELIGFGNFTWDGEVEQGIIDQLIQNCVELYPDSPVIEDTCEMVVNTFVKDVMDIVREVMEPEHICEAIGACEATTKPPKKVAP